MKSVNHLLFYFYVTTSFSRVFPYNQPVHIFPLPPGLSPKKKIGERGPEVADVLSNSSEMTDVSQSFLGVQLVWSSAKKRGKLLREAASPLLHRFRQLSYVMISTLVRHSTTKEDPKGGNAYTTKGCETSTRASISSCCMVSKQSHQNTEILLQQTKT